MFEIEKKPYVPDPPNAEASSRTPPRFMGDIPDVDFSGFEQDLFGDKEGDLLYEGDNEDQVGLDDEFGDDESPSMKALAVVPEVPKEVCDEVSDAKLARVIKNNSFKQLVGCPIRFEVGQTQDSVYTLRSLLTDFAIYKGFNFNKRDQFNVVVETQRLYKAKKRALVVLLKEHEASFQHLRPYAIMVQQCNPGSAAYIHLLDKTSTFQRMFVSFEAQKKSFLMGCRPFLGIDGCHLKGPYGGVILSRIGLDANNSLYPLAYCICKGEIFLSWSWFLEQLQVFLKFSDDKPICFMRLKGVIGALKMKWPRASIRYIANTFHVSLLYALFYVMLLILSMHAFDASIKCESVTNNMIEAFNSILKDFRPMTYLQLMEFIRRLVMSRFQLRKDERNTWKTDIPSSP
ncbi:hypothetical protein Dsin_026830 [Dipteronia sinensis]|uniref:MULE transposase domain-containing protein n=1 Tax=Dipteronia sinensis TaxID=43782 RepID=A0AAD9ZYL5_9ROSI|nr:hypothetical protein Dsin_026830 [Dipteronia sinensis]